MYSNMDPIESRKFFKVKPYFRAVSNIVLVFWYIFWYLDHKLSFTHPKLSDSIF